MSRILEQISHPGQLRELSSSQLRQLAQEIREELVARVEANGGHLSSNLGVVELSLALHRVFDSPRDKILWDVGHQSYVHKLLTGRLPRFSTLRQAGGLSGFAEPEESPHDPFVAGHASTSISAALGLAVARDLTGGGGHVIAVVGDGSIAGGMAFEGLNQAGHLKTQLLIVLNDNGMAISPSVGGLARLLHRMRFSRSYLKARGGARRVVRHLPFGGRLWGWLNGLKEGIKGLILPQALWQGLGLKYIGPVDGHNLPELEKVFRQVKERYKGPTLLHVITVKGKGYPPAEQDAEDYHGLPPPAERQDGTVSYSRVFAQSLLRLMREDQRIVAITAAMPGGTGLSLVAQEFPQRVFDVGICEQHAITFACGLARQGFIPVVAVYSTFLQRAFDQVVHDLCIQNLPVVLAIDRAGLVGEDGKTHHGALDLSYLSLIPNMVVAAPKDENELQHLLFTGVRAGRPFALRYPRGRGAGVALEAAPRLIPIGQGEEVRAGGDVALIAIGSMVYPALEAAQLLSRQGIEAAVVNARFAKPLDGELMAALARRCRWLVTVEENALWGGFGVAVGQLLYSSGIAGVRVINLGLPDAFVGQGPQGWLRSQAGLDGPGIARQVLSAVPGLAAR